MKTGEAKPFLSFSLSSLQKRAFYKCVAFLLPHITIMLLDLRWEIQLDQRGLSCGLPNPLFTFSSYTYSVLDPDHKSDACNVKEILVKHNFQIFQYVKRKLYCSLLECNYMLLKIINTMFKKRRI